MVSQGSSHQQATLLSTNCAQSGYVSYGHCNLCVDMKGTEIPVLSGEAWTRSFSVFTLPKALLSPQHREEVSQKTMHSLRPPAP